MKYENQALLEEDKLVDSIDRLTEAVTELAVKVKRLTNNNPITPEIYDRIINGNGKG